MSKLAVGTLALICLAAPAAAEPFRKVLISSGQNVRVDQAEITAKDATPKCPDKWSVRKRTLHGGKQEGVELVIIDNGKLQITVIPTRGMGVLSATLGDVRLGWDSPVKDVVHPQFINLNARGGLGWLDGFNEWLCRCGLESNGGPGPDRFINNIGDEAVMDLTLHGKSPTSRPRRLNWSWIASRRIAFAFAAGSMSGCCSVPSWNCRRKSRPSREQHVSHRRRGEQPGHAASRVRDALSREFRPAAAGGRLAVPRPPRAGDALQRPGGDGRWRVGQLRRPTPGFIEQVYLLRPLADKDGRTVLLLQNKPADRAASMSYSIKELPYLSVWKNTAAVNDGYVTGLEPGTNYPNHRAIERKAGRVPKLAGEASHAMTIDYGIHVGKDDVQKVADRIRTIQGDRKPIVDEKPEKKDSPR